MKTKRVDYSSLRCLQIGSHEYIANLEELIQAELFSDILQAPDPSYLHYELASNPIYRFFSDYKLNSGQFQNILLLLSCDAARIILRHIAIFAYHDHFAINDLSAGRLGCILDKIGVSESLGILKNQSKEFGAKEICKLVAIIALSDGNTSKAFPLSDFFGYLCNKDLGLVSLNSDLGLVESEVRHRALNSMSLIKYAKSRPDRMLQIISRITSGGDIKADAISSMFTIDGLHKSVEEQFARDILIAADYLIEIRTLFEKLMHNIIGLAEVLRKPENNTYKAGLRFVCSFYSIGSSSSNASFLSQHVGVDPKLAFQYRVASLALHMNYNRSNSSAQDDLAISFLKEALQSEYGKWFVNCLNDEGFRQITSMVDRKFYYHYATQAQRAICLGHDLSI